MWRESHKKSESEGGREKREGKWRWRKADGER